VPPKVSDFEAMLRPLAESVLEPGEELLGTCIASQQTTFRGWVVGGQTQSEGVEALGQWFRRNGSG
jgi:hypothetical protein